MVVTWVTLNDTEGDAVVYYSQERKKLYGDENKVIATKSSFRDEGSLKLVRYVYRAKMTGLEPDKFYCKF